MTNVIIAMIIMVVASSFCVKLYHILWLKAIGNDLSNFKDHGYSSGAMVISWYHNVTIATVQDGVDGGDTRIDDN